MKYRDYDEDDSYVKAMRAAEANMIEADRLAAAGDHQGALYLSGATMQAAMMLSTSEALFQGLHGHKEKPMADTRTCPPCTGDCNQGWSCPASRSVNDKIRSMEPVEFERQEPLPPGFTADEHRQQLPSPWTGLNIALALVCACLASALLLHAAARAGWL